MTSPTLATIIAGVVLWYRRYHGKHMRILLWLTLWFPPQLSNHSQVKCFQLCICAQIHINVLYSSTLKGTWNRTGYIKVFTVWLINAEDLSNWQFNDLCYRHTTFSVFQTWIKKCQLAIMCHTNIVEWHDSNRWMSWWESCTPSNLKATKSSCIIQHWSTALRWVNYT